jgi:3-(3-hydroxy-phenyl)propionate hydroxylase
MPGAPADPSGLLTSLLDDMRADALLQRPDRVVAAGADRADLRRWHGLLTSAGTTGSQTRAAGPVADA